MDSDSKAKDLERAARVRENQRRSRAKRQEHVRDLEQRLAVCKDQSQQKDIQHRLAMQKVEAENHYLKGLLGSLGVSPDLIAQYVHAASQGTVVDRKVAIPSMQRTIEHVPTPPCSSPDSVVDRKVCAPTTQQTCGPLSTPKSNSTGSTPSSTPRLPPALPIEKAEQLPTPNLCCGGSSGNEASWSSGEDVLNTTLCAIAEDLINQYNAREVDIDDIKRRLWSGFRSGQPGDGCRVQNNILFQVLDEISHGI